MSGRSGSALLPATFEERGAVVPFTTPVLSLARVRRDQRQRLILQMPNFGSAEGAFVLPWNGIAEVAVLSVHDRALLEEIAGAESIAPESLRLIGLRVGQTGLAGPLVADAARRALEAEKRRHIELHFLLSMALLNALGLAADGLLAAGGEGGNWRQQARALLAQAAPKLGLEPGDMAARLAALARVLLPHGLSSGRQDGRLRSLLYGFAEFRDGITEWSEAEKSELAVYAGFAGFIANDTLKAADRLFGQLDAGLRDIAAIIRDWHHRAKPVVALAGKLVWLLDGWDFLFVFWEQLRDEPIELQREGVARIIRVLPQIPCNEAEGPNEALELRQQQLQGRSLPTSVDWRRARADFGVTQRLETAKAKVMAR
jgi:hypothetical protein